MTILTNTSPRKAVVVALGTNEPGFPLSITLYPGASRVVQDVEWQRLSRVINKSGDAEVRGLLLAEPTPTT